MNMNSINDGVTVLTLEPLDFNLLGNSLKLQLSGRPCAGRKVIKVDYPADFSKNSINTGVCALDKALRTTTGIKLVFAHSQGAQVVSRWLRQYAGTPNAPSPNLTSFLLIGNPLRKFGGYIVGRPEVGGQIGLPTPNDTGYQVTDLKIQYDGWADYPDRPGTLAKINATRGKNGVHCYGYLKADIHDPAAKIYRENTTTYIMLPHKPLIPAYQALIEASYSRPEK